MKVTAGNWQAEAAWAGYVSPQTREDEHAKKDKSEMQMDADTMARCPESPSERAAAKSNDGFQMKSSAPDDSVGQLAALLARAETRLDVQQVSSKAIRALMNLKMALSNSEGDEQSKIRRMIKRMNKLIKRIHKKLQQLGKEEQLENRRKRAQKKKDEAEEAQILEELRSRRKKRRRDEKDYAQKEMTEDGKEAAKEAVAAISAAMSAPVSAAISAPAAPDPAAGLAAAADVGSAGMPAMEGACLDVSV